MWPSWLSLSRRTWHTLSAVTDRAKAESLAKAKSLVKGEKRADPDAPVAKPDDLVKVDVVDVADDRVKAGDRVKADVVVDPAKVALVEVVLVADEASASRRPRFRQPSTLTKMV